MAVVVLEAAQAPGWFMHVVEEVGAVKLVPGRRMASELTVADFNVDGDDGIRIRSSSGSILVVHVPEGDSGKVLQLSFETETAGSVLNVLASRPEIDSAAAAGAAASSAIPDWVRDGSEFALELASSQGVCVGNIPESAKCHAVVAVDTSLGTSPLLLRSHLVRTIRKHAVTTDEIPASAMPGSEGWGPLGDWIKLSHEDACTSARLVASADLAIERARSAVVPAVTAGARQGTGLIAKALRRLRGNSADADTKEAEAQASFGGSIRHLMKRIASTVTDVPPRPLPDPTGTPLSMALSKVQLASFAAQGFLVIDDVIPPPHLHSALRAINSDLGRIAAGALGELPRAAAPRASASSTPPPKRGDRDPALMSLACETRVWGAINSLLGCKCVEAPTRSRVDLQFPEPLGAEEPQGTWSVDGMGSGAYAPCSLVCGVMLSDTLEEGSGQLAVYPGTHLVLAEHLRSRGDGWLEPGAPRPDLGAIEPVPICAKAGSVVLLHPLVARRNEPNRSSAIRYACFFHPRHVRHGELRARLPEDALALFPALAKTA